MAQVSLPYTLTAGQPENVNQLNSNLNTLVTGVNSIDGDNLTATVASQAGLSSTASARRGKSIIATTESRTSTSYGLMTTPDRVSSVVLPTDGLICVLYQALWQESVSGAARAAIFLGSNQLKVALPSNNPFAVAACTKATASFSVDVTLASFAGGLASVTQSTSTLADVTTGQVVGMATDQAAYEVAGTPVLLGSQFAGGICHVFAAAGTYDVSVQFKSSSGSVTVKNRKLWVWTVGF